MFPSIRGPPKIRASLRPMATYCARTHNPDYVARHIIRDDRARHAPEVPEGVLQALEELVGPFTPDRLAVGLARMAQHDPKDVGATPAPLDIEDGRPGPEVHLGLVPRQALQAAEGKRQGLPEVPDESLDAVVTAGKAVIGHQILVDPLGRQPLRELRQDDLAVRFASAGRAGWANR